MEVLEALSQMFWNSLVFAETLFVRFKAGVVSLPFICATTSVANLSVVVRFGVETFCKSFSARVVLEYIMITQYKYTDTHIMYAYDIHTHTHTRIHDIHIHGYAAVICHLEIITNTTYFLIALISFGVTGCV